MDSRILDKWDGVHAWCHRWRWWRRVAVAVILLSSFWRFAQTRMTTPPLDPNALERSLRSWTLPPDCEGLLAAIGRIPTLPPLPTPPVAPPGKHWVPTTQAKRVALPLPSIDPVEALAGPWTPETRHYLSAIIAYLETPAVQAALEECVPDKTVGPAAATTRPVSSAMTSLGQVRSLAKLLCVRARYDLLQHHDAAASARGFRRVLDLAASLEQDGYLIQQLVAIAMRSLVYEEIVNGARQVALTRSQAQEFLAALQSRPFDLKAAWRTANRREGQFPRRAVDACYTKDAEGNGWIVLSAPWGGGLGQKMQSFLNVLSPLVNDRRTMVGKMQFAIDRADAAVDLPFSQAQKVLDYDSQGQGMGNLADGPLAVAMTSSHRHAYKHFVRCGVAESAAIASLALSAWHAERGQYPGRLADLVPQYLPALPSDAVIGQPLLYRLDVGDGYSLYSPGDDGADDGGEVRTIRGEVKPSFDGNDWTFSGLEWQEDGAEWYLVPDDTEQQSATSQPQ